MKTALLALGVLCIMGSCSSEMKSSKGIVCDASMNTVSIVTDKNDTLSFSTMDANKEQVDGLLLNDTLEVFYAGNIHRECRLPNWFNIRRPPDWAVTVMSTVVSVLLDTYGVKYKRLHPFIWKGIRTEAVNGGETSAFIVFSPDSTRAELFFSDKQPNEILERRSLPSGGYAWNVEDDDTKNVRLVDGLWTISQRGDLIYTQKLRTNNQWRKSIGMTTNSFLQHHLLFRFRQMDLANVKLPLSYVKKASP